ncbi:alpha/beta hydrolase [Alkalihalobacterium bogoriense]|uniref:alpha/beta hydrolase n=1 Tax=Alkalihalobacterium bogoriense TaxID=246272 RepID=UPI000686DCF8|nr:alpha/beta hydrolase [Alkalihalobacterium bogoriense]
MEIYETEKIVDLVYGETKERTLKLDIVKPKSKESFPAIIYVHGGGWMAGDKSKVGGEWNASFAKYGFVCVNINFRLSGEAIFPAPLLDIKTAISWIKDHADEYGIDREKIGLWGHSSGGHLATLTAFSAGHNEFTTNSKTSEQVQAVCALAGPVDLLSMGTWHDLPNSPEAKFIGGSLCENEERAKKTNPISYIEENPIPSLLIHGDYDEIVPVEQSRLLHNVLPNSTYLEIKGADHDFIGGMLSLDEILPIVRSFFEKTLKQGLLNKEQLARHRAEVKKVVEWFKENSK